MQQAIAFELGRQTAANQAELLRVQALQVIAETEGVFKNNELIDCQIDKCRAEIVLLEKEAIKADAEIINLGFQNDLIEQQIEKLKQDIILTQEQILNLGAERRQIEANISLTGKQEDKLDQDILVAKQEVLQSIQQTALITQQVINLEKDLERLIADIEFTKRKTSNAAEEFFVIQQQWKKIKEEIQLVKQKVKTEEANVSDKITVISGYDSENNPIFEEVTVGGLIGRKNTLFKRQGDAYLRDAEQKAAKIYTDIWNVSKAADPFGLNPGELLGDVDYPEVIVDGETTYPPSPKLETDESGNKIYEGAGVAAIREVLETLRQNVTDRDKDGTLDVNESNEDIDD
jgi:hypothetical protein